MAAELQSPMQAPPAVNLAPLKPLLELKRGAKKPSSYIQKAIQEKFQHYHRENRDVWREIYNVGQLTDLYINGKQFLCRNPVDGSWGILPIKGNDDSSRRALNVMRNLKQNLLGKWENSNPDILIRPGRNLDTCVSAAKAADTINNYYERQFYNHWFTQQEGSMGMSFGTYIDRFRFDDSKESMSVVQDIFETKNAQFGEGLGYCAECEYVGNDSEFKSQMGGEGPFARPMCPHCRSTAVEVLDAPQGELPSVVGQQKKQIGDLVCEILPLPSCRFDLTKRPEESSWFMYRQTIPKGSITRVLGNVLIPEGGTEHDYGLEVLKSLGLQGSALSGYSAFGNQGTGIDGERKRSEELTFDELWLSPDDIADIELIGDEETVDGPRLPKGKLVDVFPEGLCAVGLNGMAVVLALYPEQHRNHIVSGTWFMQTATGVGRGLADTVEIQKQFNTLNNQAMGYMSATYTPAIMYNNQILTGNKMRYIGTAKTNIPVDLTRLPEGAKLADAIHQFAPTAMPNQFFNYAQNFLNVMFQKTSMVTDYAQGEPGITATNTTATAAEIDQGNADAINQPIFMIKADCRKRGAEITINLFRKHFPMKRYFDLGGKFGRQQGIELSGADVQADLSFEVAKNSEMPKGPYTRQKNRIQFFNTIGGMEGLAMGQQSYPQILAKTAQDFDVDIEIDGSFDAVAEICRKRLNQMTAAAKMGIDDPKILIEAIQPPISAREPNLGAKAKWFADWLDTDEGQEAPMPLRAAAEFLTEGEIQGQTMQETEVATQQGMVQAAAMAPAAIGGAALEQQASPEHSADPDPTAVLQAEQDIATAEMEAAENERQRQHEKEMLKAEGERDKDVAQHDATQKIRIEKAKPKPKPAAKKAGAKKK